MISSSGACASQGWIEAWRGSASRMAATSASAIGIRGSGLLQSVSGKGAGKRVSHHMQAWLRGSLAMIRWSIVVPVRISPITTIGATISSSRISGCRVIQSWVLRRVSRLSMTRERMIVRPSSFSGASSRSDCSSTPSGSRKSSSPKSVRPVFACASEIREASSKAALFSADPLLIYPLLGHGSATSRACCAVVSSGPAIGDSRSDPES